MKTLEHEIRDVLNRIQLDERKKSSKPVEKDNSSSTISSDDALDAASLVPGPVGMVASGEIARREAIKGNYPDAALAALGMAPGIGRFTSAARVGSKVGSKLAKNSRKTKRKGGEGNGKGSDKRKGSGGKWGRWGRRLAALGGGGSPSKKDRDKSGYTDPGDLVHSGRVFTGGGPVRDVTVESREDIEATPRFTETDRKKIDVVPRAENDLDTANRKRFRMENIKKKIIDDEFNIRHEFNNFLIEENIELTEEEYDEAFDILFHYFVHDLNENIGSTLYKGAKKTLGFVGRRVLAPGFYASDAVEKYKKGDTSGALISGAKTVASVTPIGAAASLAHDAYEARKDIADVAKRGYDYVRKSLFGKPKPSNQISQNKRKPSGLQGTSVT
jgi:hypothetical protein